MNDLSAHPLISVWCQFSLVGISDISSFGFCLQACTQARTLMHRWHPVILRVKGRGERAFPGGQEGVCGEAELPTKLHTPAAYPVTLYRSNLCPSAVKEETALLTQRTQQFDSYIRNVAKGSGAAHCR